MCLSCYVTERVGFIFITVEMALFCLDEALHNVNIYPKVIGGLNIIGNIPGIFFKNLEKSWKYHGILSVQKCGNPDKSFILD